jgi:RND family efflux transporter MFP subunit
MKKILTLVIILAVVTVIVGLLLFNKSKMEKKSKTEFMTSFPVTVTKVSKERLDDFVSSVGTLIPNREVIVGSETSGKLTGVYFEIGDRVNAGKTLAKVDDELRKYTLDNATANFEKAKKDIERYEELFKESSVTEAQLEAVRLVYETAYAQYSSADKQLRDTWINCPLSGIVTEKKIEKGSIVSPGTPIATIVDISSIKAKVNVPESDAFKLKIGDIAEITTDIYPEEKFSGKIININAKGDEAHTFPIEVLMKNSNTTPLRAGMFVKVYFKTVPRFESLIIPRASLVGSAKNPQVYVIENGTAKLRDVVLGITLGDKLEIINGLSEGDVIVLDGQLNIKDNDPVTIVTQGS